MRLAVLRHHGLKEAQEGKGEKLLIAKMRTEKQSAKEV